MQSKSTASVLAAWWAVPVLEGLLCRLTGHLAPWSDLGQEALFFGLLGLLLSRLTGALSAVGALLPAVLLCGKPFLTGEAVHTPTLALSVVAGLGVLTLALHRRRIGPLLGVALSTAAVLAVDQLSGRVGPFPMALPWVGLGLGLLTLVHPALVVAGALGLVMPLPAPASSDGPPVVLISVDTLRWDEMQTMSVAKRLAAEGSYWPRAMSTSSWTVPALASLLTGAPPEVHGATAVRGGSPTAIRAEVHTLAERLGRAGYRSAAFVENPHLHPVIGLSRGFSAFDNPLVRQVPLLFLSGPVRCPEQTEHAQQWMADAPDSGVFLWVHYFEPHLPYRHFDRSDRDDPLNQALSGQPMLMGAIRDGKMVTTPESRARLREAYRAEIAWVDAAAQRLVDTIRARWPDAIIVMTADHGEEFWEHGSFEHGHSHHGEVVDVGLIMVGPGMPVATRSDLASLNDVTPTLLKMTGVPAEGVDLRQPQASDRMAFALGTLYGPELRSARLVERRAIAGKAEYDLLTDPGEQTPLPAGPLSAAAAAIPDAQIGEAAPLDIEVLKAFGYVE